MTDPLPGPSDRPDDGTGPARPDVRELLSQVAGGDPEPLRIGDVVIPLHAPLAPAMMRIRSRILESGQIPVLELSSLALCACTGLDPGTPDDWNLAVRAIARLEEIEQSPAGPEARRLHALVGMGRAIADDESEGPAGGQPGLDPTST